MNYHELITKYREHFHAYPEVSLNEVNTSAYIRGILESLGFEIRTCSKGCGLVAYVKGQENNDCYAFRADMDALSIEELTSRDNQSTTKGVSHACGHDGHMAILLGLAHYLKDNPPQSDIYLIFQHAEEGPGGALDIIEEGLLQNPRVKAVFGYHLMPNIKEGLIGTRSGAIMARTAEFDIEVLGKGSHGAIPHEGTDALMIASNLVSTLQSVISRNINPLASGVVSIGKIVGGERRNAIAHRVRMEGTIRAFDDKVYVAIKDRISSICKGFEVSYSCKIEFIFRDMYDAVFNDDMYVKKIMDCVEGVIEVEPLMASEDFGYYIKHFGGAFMFLGCQNDELSFNKPLHNPAFDYRNEVLHIGFEKAIQIINHMEKK